MEKQSKVLNCIKWAGLLMLLLMMAVMMISMVAEKVDITDRRQVVPLTQWVLTDGSGQNTDITVPYMNTLAKGEKYSISTVIPELELNEDSRIFINAVQSDVEVWVGGEKRLSYLGKEMKVPVINAPTRYLFVPVSEEDCGKTITIEFCGMTRYNGRVFGVAIGTESAVWMQELSQHGVTFGLSIFGIIVAACAFIASFLTFGGINARGLRYLSVGGMSICLWLLCEHRLNQLIFSEPLFTGIFTYIFVLLMPIPMVLFINEVQHRRYQKLIVVEASVLLIDFIVLSILNFSTNLSYSVSMPVHHVIVGIIIGLVMATLVKDSLDKERIIKSYSFVAVGLVAFALATLVEIAFLLIVDFYVIGMYIVPGLILLVFLTAMQVAKDTLADSERKRKVMEQATINTIRIIAGAIDARDEYTGGHSSRVAYYASTLVKEMGYSEEDVNEVYYVGLLHDIGKIGIPDSILNKAGKLSSDEYHLMKFHSSIGAELLSKMETDERLIQGIRGHHERYDGNGYPDGLKGKDIPEIARILCLADSYDAMTSNRVYRNRLTPEQVEVEIMKNAGTQFDPELAKIFCNLISTGVISPTTYNGFERSVDGSLSKSAVIQRMIMAPAQFAGTNEVSRPEFMRMLMYILKIAEKNNTETSVLLFSLNGKKGTELSQEELSRGMGMLANAMALYSKSTDVVTQYSENQRVIAVIGSNGRDYKNIGNETVKAFNEMDSARKYEVDFRVVDWNTEAL